MESTPGIGKVDLSNQVSIQVAKKAMDLQRQQGQAALALLKAASEVQSSQADRPGNGGLDVHA